MADKKTNLQTLKGFRDFLPEEKRKRDFVMQKIKQTFELFGFEPLETPALEYASLLLGKYGEEADKMVYTFKDRGGRKVALRYDQTVPTARVLLQNNNPETLPKILRRYQIQNVFRADKPQKGRYREFTQCDVDIFGPKNTISDAEIITCATKCLEKIGIKDYQVLINDRMSFEDLLTNIQENLEFKDILVKILAQSVDKLEKTGKEKVIREILTNPDFQKKLIINEGGIQQLRKFLSLKPVTLSNTKTIKKYFGYPPSWLERIEEIIKKAILLGAPENNLLISPTLARGLDYYTSTVFEIIIPNKNIGSVGGGGRYDELIYQLSNFSIGAVGFSFGLDRLVEIVNELKLFPKNISSPTAKILVTIFKETLNKSLKTTQKLRKNNIKTEIFPDLQTPTINEAIISEIETGKKKSFQKKLQQQLKYASKKAIPFVLIIGPDEAKANQVTLKDMTTGKQQTLPLDQVINKLK